MRRVCVGVHVYAEPERLRATLAALRANTPTEVEVQLLPDGPDRETIAALASFGIGDGMASALVGDGMTTAMGAPACFNRLATGTDADVIVLLESGALVAPCWLEHLLAPFDMDGNYGLAGPSTNHCWNEQGVFPRSGDSFAEIAFTAQQARERFAGRMRTLAPLYSLSDFCYAVRREVLDTVGEADEGYGPGPCWEMDYNIRAARAGFQGVWVCSSYVHRTSPTMRRRYDERRLFEANKRRYQDKFCGARLRGEKSDYRTHCRGDACPNFAPPSLIPINETPPPAPADHSQPRLAQNAYMPEESTPIWHGTASAPLVTCIMPTADRRAFVPQAIRCFLRQDYPHTELIVLDDGADPIADCVPADARIRYIRLNEKLSIGAKRNIACTHARGEFIVHWDDDDWYPTWRVGRQLRAMQESGADVCGTSQLFYYNAATSRAWRYAYGGNRAPWVSGNTLAYRKSFWERRRFPEIQIGEDSRFVWSAPAGSVHDLADPTLCIAAVHGANTSSKDTEGFFWHPQAWADIQTLLGDDLHFYRTAALTISGKQTWPLVTCIMPTFNRRPFIPLALSHFRNQDYPNKELVIVDDGSDKIGDLVEGLPDVHYISMRKRVSIGAKRNVACTHARGEFIAHWDDDDWYASDRLRYQVAPLLTGEADLTGLVNSFVLELPGGEFWTTLPHMHPRMFVGDVHGGTLVYRKALLEMGIRYPEINLAEDAALINQAVNKRRRLLRLTNPGVFVYVRHGSNAWREYAPGSFLDPNGWQRIPPPQTFPSSFLPTYQTAAALMHSNGF